MLPMSPTTVRQAQTSPDTTADYEPLYNITRMRDGPLNTPCCALYVVYVLRQVIIKAMISPAMLSPFVA